MSFLGFWLVSFLSGASALVFETLWFRAASLIFGSSVHASSVVLASFMGGLALGSGLAAWRGGERARPARDYAVVELAIGAAGLLLCLSFPSLERALAPLFGALSDSPAALGLVRFVAAFALLIVPTTAMGATLPILVTLLSRRDPHFGRVLGRLYGFNTAGAVAGALLVETVFIPRFGLTGAAVLAALMNASAAAIAGLTSALLAPPEGTRASHPRAPEKPARRGQRAEAPVAVVEEGRGAATRFMVAAALSGGALLALEVVWFRFLQLFVVSTGLAMTLILAVVLFGISTGGLLAGAGLARRPDSSRRVIVPLALVAGASVAFTYAAFRWVVGNDLAMATQARQTLALAFPLAFPTSALSGALFTVLGDRGRRLFANDTRAAGLLTLANTVGAMSGAILGGFVLLPVFGTERAILSIVAVYGAIAALMLSSSGAEEHVPLWRTRPVLAGAVALAIALATFPYGVMAKRYLPLTARRYFEPGQKVIETREGRTETLVFTEKRWHDKPIHSRLITNGFSMSGTQTIYKRYMKLYVYLPAALHPNLERALLISFGVGSTAKALTDTKSLKHIDVVDTSKDILEFRRHVFRDASEDPLADPRVSVHIEDGRHFLLTTRETFDLITGEPPPPKAPGIVNLYTREYFELMRGRLSEGGMVTYWLPVDDLLIEDSKSITAAFCAAFPDCTLWAGSGYQWMLVGTKDLKGPASEEAFARQWQDPVVGPEMRALGFERPEQLGALFMADGAALAAWLGSTPPLEDDHPARLSPTLSPSTQEYLAKYLSLMDPAAARRAFLESAFIARTYPTALQARTLASFEWQGLLNAVAVDLRLGQSPPYPLMIAKLHEVLTKTELETLPLWLLGSEARHQAAVEALSREGGAAGDVAFGRALDTLSRRAYGEAAEHFSRAEAGGVVNPALVALRAYALAMDGQLGEARALCEVSREKRDPLLTVHCGWLANTFRLELGLAE